MGDHPEASGVYVEDGRIDELAASQKRVEGKQNAFEVSFARAETRLETKLDNITATLVVLGASLTGLDVRVGALERTFSSLDARVNQLDKTDARRANNWPAILSAIVAAVMAVLFVGSLLYGH